MFVHVIAQYNCEEYHFLVKIQWSSKTKQKKQHFTDALVKQTAVSDKPQHYFQPLSVTEMLNYSSQ